MLATLGISLAVIVSGCSSPTSALSSAPPTLTVPTFASPSSTSATAGTSVGAQTALAAAAGFNGILQDSLLFLEGRGTQQGGTWTWITQSSALTATVTSSGGNYSLNLVFDGTCQNENYSDTYMLTGPLSPDGSTGNWSMTTPSEDAQLTRSTDANGTPTGTITTSGSNNAKDILTDDADKSGKLKVHTKSAETIDVTWNSNGFGKWTECDPKGNTINSGSWS